MLRFYRKPVIFLVKIRLCDVWKTKKFHRYKCDSTKFTCGKILFRCSKQINFPCSWDIHNRNGNFSQSEDPSLRQTGILFTIRMNPLLYSLAFLDSCAAAVVSAVECNLFWTKSEKDAFGKIVVCCLFDLKTVQKNKFMLRCLTAVNWPHWASRTTYDS